MVPLQPSHHSRPPTKTTTRYERFSARPIVDFGGVGGGVTVLGGFELGGCLACACPDCPMYQGYMGSKARVDSVAGGDRMVQADPLVLRRRHRWSILAELLEQS